MTERASVPSDEELRERLSPEEYAVLRRAATERAWTGALLDEHRAGLYSCKACGNELFLSGTKFDSGCGWPSFYDVVRPGAVRLLPDRSLGQERTEVRCGRCDSHLGHVFPDGFGTPTGDRYCMNSLALDFGAEHVGAGDVGAGGLDAGDAGAGDAGAAPPA
ncbi:MAG: peptide-methionine (R)-S-oxide reductase MsrB [Microbacteriaceae bacterium]